MEKAAVGAVPTEVRGRRFRAGVRLWELLQYLGKVLGALAFLGIPKLAILLTNLILQLEHSEYIRMHPILDFFLFASTAWILCQLHQNPILSPLWLSARGSLEFTVGLLLRPAPRWLAPQCTVAVVDFVMQASKLGLRYLAANSIVAVIPEGWQASVPRALQFLDANGDGILQAIEIQGWFHDMSTRVFAAALVGHLGVSLLDAKQCPKELIPPPEEWSVKDANGINGLASKFFYRLQRAQQMRPSDSRVQALDKMVNAAIYVLMVLPWLSVFGLRVQTVLALGGAGSVAIGLASKNIVGNAIAGILIYVNRNFLEGDEIESKSRKIRGVVESIGITTTKVNQLNGMPIQVPNSLLLEDSLVIRTVKYVRMMEERFTIMLPDLGKVRPLVEQVNQLLQEHPSILSGEDVRAVKKRYAGRLLVYAPVFIHKGLGVHGVQFYLRAYVKGSMDSNAFLLIQSNVNMMITDEIQKAGGTLVLTGMLQAAVDADFSNDVESLS